MAGLMDFVGGMFGGGDIYGDLLSDEQKNAMQQQTMLTMAAKLLQAGGPSPTPTNFGQALGGAFLSGQEAYGKAGQNALTQMLTKQKIEEYKRKKDVEGSIQNFLMGGGAPSTSAMPAPDLRGVVGRASPEGAMMPAQAGMPAAAGQPSPMNSNAATAERYRALAQKIAPIDPARANAYLTMADKLSPMVKPSGQPFEVRAPNDPNKTIFVQSYTDGSIKPVDGFTPPGMSDYQRQQLAISSANLGISQEQLRRGQYTLQQTADGYAYVPKIPGLPVIPIMAQGGVPFAGVPGVPGGAGEAKPTQLKPAGAKPTADQSNAVGFAQRMERSDALLKAIPDQFPGVGTAIASSLPFVGDYAARQAMSPQQQQFKQAADDWIRAKLRKESGAAIGEREMEQEYATYFPLPGDSPEVIIQKAQARRVATEAMKAAAGEYYKPWEPTEEEKKMIQSMTGAGGGVSQQGLASGAAAELQRRRANGGI